MICDEHGPRAYPVCNKCSDAAIREVAAERDEKNEEIKRLRKVIETVIAHGCDFCKDHRGHPERCPALWPDDQKAWCDCCLLEAALDGEINE